MIGFRSIKSRILAFAVLATLVPALGLGVLTYWRHQALIGENLAIELRTLGHYAHSEVSLWIDERTEDLRALAGAGTILEALSAKTHPAPQTRQIAARQVEAYLHAVKARLGSMLELSVFDVDSEMLASTAGTRERSSLSTASIASTDFDGPDAVALGPPRRDGEHGTATIAVVVPIRALDGRRVGALSAILDLGRIQSRLERITRFSAAEIVLLAPDGEPVLGARGGVDGLSRVAPAVIERMQAQPGEPTPYEGHRGRAVVGVAASPVLSTISIIAERESAGVYSERRRLLGLFTALTAALTLVVGALAWWIGRSIVVPLGGLVRAVDRVAGGDLDVHLPVDRKDEIGRLTRSLGTMAERLRESRDAVERANQALQRQNRQLEEIAITDGLTGLNNRKRLDAILAEQLALFRRHHRPFAIVMLDLDHFKALNDTFGHLAGDRVLAHVARTLQGCVRNVDHVARYGGEEFVVVLVEATLDGALDTAERIRCAIEASEVVVDDRPISVTVSLGVTRCRDGDARGEDLISRADAALYKAKYAGRNRVYTFDLAQEPTGAAKA